MVDILERLQSPQTSLGTLWPQPNLHEEAAEKIAQLRKELDETKRAADAFVENEHLREENARLREVIQPFAERIEVVKRLREENTRLRNAVKAAYYEGWQDRESIVATEDQLHSDWEGSEACAAILGKVKAEAACPEPDEAP